MRVVFYARDDYPQRQRLVSLLQQLPDHPPLENHAELDRLMVALLSPRIGNLALIMLAADQNDLSQILAHQEILIDIPLILVLPNDQPATIRAGHLLRPRFINFAGNDFGEVLAVLARLLSRLR